MDEKPLRADAVRNRALILAAASQLFAERGLEVSLDEIADRAGVGVGTVYRRFGTRDAIIATLFQERIGRTETLAKECLADEDPFRGLVTLLRLGCQEVATDKGMRQAMLSAEYADANLVAGRSRIEPLADRLVQRCHRANALRPGFTSADIPLIFLMVGAVGDFAGPRAPQLWERYFDMLIEGIRPGAPAWGVPPLSTEQLHSTVSSWRPGKHT